LNDDLLIIIFCNTWKVVDQREQIRVRAWAAAEKARALRECEDELSRQAAEAEELTMALRDECAAAEGAIETLRAEVAPFFF